MTVLTLDIERPPILGAGPSDSAGREVGDSAGLTLDDVIAGAWGQLLGHNTVSCPVCSGAMAPRYGAGSAPVGGRCADCGSALG